MQSYVKTNVNDWSPQGQCMWYTQPLLSGEKCCQYLIFGGASQTASRCLREKHFPSTLSKYWDFEGSLDTGNKSQKTCHHFQKLNIRPTLRFYQLKICDSRDHTSCELNVTNIIYSLLWFYLSTLSSQWMDHPGFFFIQGGDSSYPWVSVHALGHIFGKDRTITQYPLLKRPLNNKEHTRLQACTLLLYSSQQVHSEPPLWRGGEWQS